MLRLGQEKAASRDGLGAKRGATNILKWRRSGVQLADGFFSLRCKMTFQPKESLPILYASIVYVYA